MSGTFGLDGRWAGIASLTRVSCNGLDVAEADGSISGTAAARLTAISFAISAARSGSASVCQVIETRSSFYAWLAAAPGRAARAAADAALAGRIRALQDPQQGGDRASGAPRITADLNENAAEDERVNHKRGWPA